MAAEQTLVGIPEIRVKAKLEQIATVLRATPIFAPLTDSELLGIATRALRKNLGAGEVLFSEGEPCTGLYVILSGHVRIYKISRSIAEQMRQRRRTVVDAAVAFLVILLIVQMWLLTATLGAYLAGNTGAALPGTLVSLISFLGCFGLHRFVDRVYRT